MNSGNLMIASSVVFGLTGVACLFLSREIAVLAGLGQAAGIAVEVAAAGLLAVAVLDWMGRTAIYGGVYGRPIVLANLMFGLVAGLGLLGHVLDGGGPAWLAVVGGLFLAHGVAFGVLMRRGPWER